MLPYAVRYLGSEPLLYLEAICIAVQHTSQFRDADYAVARQICDVRFALDRRHVMFAMRMERNVAQKDHLVIASDFLESPFKVDGGIFIIAATIFFPCPCHSCGRILQSLSVRIVASPTQDGAKRLLDFRRNCGLAVYGEARVIQGRDSIM